MAEIKLKLKDTWVDIKSNKVLQTLISEETIYIDDDLNIESMTQYYKNQRIGTSEHEGVRHIVAIVQDEGLSKEEMFDFILENNVTLTPSNGVWFKKNDDGTEVRCVHKYSVSINDCGMSGFDLVDAINYYVKEMKK